jgi:hypothetical protein
LADIDADGHIDLISGSWPGEIFLFKGEPGRTFAKPVKIKGHDGKSINIGGGIRKDSGDGMLLIAGDAQFENTPEGDFVVYEGERIKVEEGRSAGITGTASSVGVADLDGDGDLDLLVGDIGGNVWLVTNEGTPQRYAFAKEVPLRAGGQAVRVEGDAGPFAADWDGDGKLDILVGAGDGSVTLFRNTGGPKAPEFAEGRQLVPPAQTIDFSNPPEDVVRGIRTKVCAADWDGDGKLDLLVGDMTYQKPKPPELTEVEKAEHAKLRAELDALRERHSTLINRYFNANRERPPKEQRDALSAELREVQQKRAELEEKLPREMEYHGWVWLYRRRP